MFGFMLVDGSPLLDFCFSSSFLAFPGDMRNLREHKFYNRWCARIFTLNCRILLMQMKSISL